MKRGRKPLSSNKSDMVKVTIVLESALKMHLAVAALATGQEQSEIVRDALKQRLQEMGVDLSQPPQLPNLKRLPSFPE